MPAQVKKIRPDIVTDPKTLLGMLMGDIDQIDKIVAVVKWKNDEYQMVNNALPHSEMALCLVVLQHGSMRDIFED